MRGMPERATSPNSLMKAHIWVLKSYYDDLENDEEEEPKTLSKKVSFQRRERETVSSGDFQKWVKKKRGKDRNEKVSL